MSQADDLQQFLLARQQQRAKGPTIKAPAPSAPRKASAPKFVGGTGGGTRFYNGGKLNTPAPAPKKSGGGSWYSGITSAISHPERTEQQATKWQTQKLDLAAHDVAAMPAGFLVAGKALSHDAANVDWYTNHALGLHTSNYENQAHKGGWESGKVGKAIAKSTWDSMRHPLRDPFNTALTAFAVASLGAGSVARAGAASDALGAASRVGEGADAASALDRAGAAAKAFAKKPQMPNRILKLPTEDLRNGKVVKGTKDVQLTASQKPLTRALQELHDRILQRKLNQETVGSRDILRKYAYRRVGHSFNETARRTENVDSSLPMQIESLKGLRGIKGVTGLTKKQAQLALTLHSYNVLPHEISDFWNKALGESPHSDQLAKMSDMAQQLHDNQVLELKRGKVVINKKMYPGLHAASQLAGEGAKAREAIIQRYGLMSPEGMAVRKSLPAEVVRSEAARGANGTREGNYYSSLRLSRKQATRFPRPAAVSGNVVGTVKDFLRRGATGEGLRHGLIPDDLLGGVARDLREANQYKAKFDARANAYKAGTVYSKNHDDIFVRNPFAKTKPLSAKFKQHLGQELSQMDTVGEDASMRERFQQQFSDILNPKQAGRVGVKAEGGKWVPKEVVGDLTKSVAPRGRVAKKMDAINSWITAATVYAKPSHVPQRAVTDATTSLFSGALSSSKTHEFSRQLDKALSKGDKVDMAQATGTHGYLALPHEGEGMGAKAATTGANFYARTLDARFRRLNLVHEARKAGVDTPAKFKKLLAYAKDPSKRIPIKEAQNYEQILRRSDRVSMMYDGLTANERATMSRILWFYPWTKAAFRYGGHVAMEHPLAAAGINQLSKQGEKYQKHLLGRVPSFEYGFVPYNSKKGGSPGWLSPFNTTGQMLEMGARPEQLVGNLNPANQAALTAFSGVNSYGQNVGGPLGYPSLSAAAGELFQPTPEASILHDFLDRKGAERKTHMFPHSPGQDFYTRLLGGPTFPRRYNRKAMHKAHDIENGGYYDILVHKKKH